MASSNTVSFTPRGDTAEIETGDLFEPKFDADGLIPAIVTDAGSGDVLMFAWMNEEALALTVATRIGHFWSRSRKALWKKGAESGNVLDVVELRTDCDQDVVWLSVNVAGDGVACHTGQRSCFYRSVDLGPRGEQAVPLSPAKTSTKL
jgi:phosphoribosyl-AMP cyclohydrolase